MRRSLLARARPPTSCHSLVNRLTSLASPLPLCYMFVFFSSEIVFESFVSDGHIEGCCSTPRNVSSWGARPPRPAAGAGGGGRAAGGGGAPAGGGGGGGRAGAAPEKNPVAGRRDATFDVAV